MALLEIFEKKASGDLGVKSHDLLVTVPEFVDCNPEMPCQLMQTRSGHAPGAHAPLQVP